MKRLKKIEGDQLANATRHEVFDELLPEVDAIAFQESQTSLSNFA